LRAGVTSCERVTPVIEKSFEMFEWSWPRPPWRGPLTVRILIR